MAVLKKSMTVYKNMFLTLVQITISLYKSKDFSLPSSLDTKESVCTLSQNL